MIATWVVGKSCSISDLGPKLQEAPFDCVVVIMSTQVTRHDQIWQDLRNVAGYCEPANSPTGPVAALQLGHDW